MTRHRVKRDKAVKPLRPLSRVADVSGSPTAPDVPSQTKWQRRAQWLRNHPFVVVMETVGLVGLLVAVGLFVYELRERQDERVARAWTLLTTPAPGNSGKREALEYLNSAHGCLPFGWNLPSFGSCWKERKSLTGIDLSTAVHGGSVSLTGIELVGADLRGSDLSGSNFFGADLTGVNLFISNASRVNFNSATLRYTDLTAVDLSNSLMIAADLQGANFFRAKLVGTSLSRANLSNADMRNADLSNADLQNIVTDENTALTGIWAWADRRPKNMPPEIEAVIELRDPTQRKVDE